MAKRKKRPWLSRLLWRSVVALAALTLVIVMVERIAGMLGPWTVPTFVALFVVAGYLWTLGRIRRLRRIARFADLLALAPADFECAIAGLLADLGYRDVERVGTSGDLGADITCKDRKGRSIVVQCKRHAPGIKVGSKEVQSFIGMMAVHHGADGGIFVTTSEFTQPGVDLARRHGVWLVDGTTLGELIERSRLGRGARGQSIAGVHERIATAEPVEPGSSGPASVRSE